MLIGAHVSIAGGIDKSIQRAVDIGANCIQTFASSPRTLAFKPVDPDTIKSYLEQKKQHGIQKHLFHGIYLINLAHENPVMLQKGVESLISYQQLAGQIEGMGTVFHIGSHKGKGLESVLNQVAKAIKEVIDQTPDGVTLYLENAAGHKGTIGQTFIELSQILDAVSQLNPDMSKLAVCIDTQHAFASGYDLRNSQGLEQMLDEADSTFGLDLVQTIHINDSLMPFDSKRDRHANIGEGEIGTQGLSSVVNHPKLKHLPFFLEVPGKDKSGPRKQDVDQLKSLFR